METNSVLARVMRTGVIGVVAAAVVAGGGGEVALGQQQPGMRQVPGVPGQNRAGVAAPEVDPGPVISVNFPGGTVAEYVEAVKRAAGETPVNVLLPAEAADVQAPPITLRGVTVRTALEALTYAFVSGGGGITDAFGVRSFGDGSGDGGTTPAFAVMYQRGYQPPSPMQASGQQGRLREQVQVFSLTEIVNPPGAGKGVGVPVEVLLTAVEAALGLGAGEGETTAQVRFHEDSGLLIVRGMPEQMGLVSSLLGELRKDVVSRWVDARKEEEREAEWKYRQKRSEVEIGLAERELAAALTRLERIRELVKVNQAPTIELDEAELQVAKREAQLEMLRLEAQRPMPATQGQSSGRSGASSKPGDGGMDASVMAQLIVDLQRRVTELQGEVDRLRSEKR